MPATPKIPRIIRNGYDFDLRDHGVPVKQGLVLAVRTGRDHLGRERIYVSINAGPYVFVSIDPSTGRSTYCLSAPDATGPWDMAMASRGRVLVTSVGGHLSVFDPAEPDAGLRVIAKIDEWAWCITPAGDGWFYLGTQPNAQLFRFNIDHARLESLGRVASDGGAIRLMQAGEDGFLYMMVGFTAAQVYARRLSDGSTSPTLPADEVVPGGHTLGRGNDGAIYARSAKGNHYRLRNGAALLIDKHAFPGFAPERLASGEAIRYSDPDMLVIGEGPAERRLPIEYETAGAGIFHIAPGPNNDLYGSSIMPLYLFHYDPAGDTLTNLGRGAPETGEIYSFGHVDGKLYYATYGGEGSFLVYDPKSPWRTGKGFHDWHYNPRVISVLGTGHCRPRALHIDARKRVWVGSYAEYGKHNGGLYCYDIASDTYHNNPLVVPGQSICALTADDQARFVYGGTDTTPGSGAQPITKEGQVFAWDPEARRVAWSLVPVEGETTVPNLLFIDGKLYGTTRPKGSFFELDPRTRQVTRMTRSEVSDANEQSMGVAADGNIYGTTWPALFRWRPGGDVETLAFVWGDEVKHYAGAIFRGGGAIVGDRIYFKSHTHLLSMKLPLEHRL